MSFASFLPKAPQSMLFGHNTPQSMLSGHNTPQSMLFGHNTPQSMLFGHSTPQTILFGHSTPQSMLFVHNTPQTMLFGPNNPQSMLWGCSLGAGTSPTQNSPEYAFWTQHSPEYGAWAQGHPQHKTGWCTSLPSEDNSTWTNICQNSCNIHHNESLKNQHSYYANSTQINRKVYWNPARGDPPREQKLTKKHTNPHQEST